MKATTVKISEIKPNPDNPRVIKDDAFKKLVQSIKEFPEMIEAREIVVNTDMVILGGNMRFRALKEAGVTDVPVKIVDWAEDKQREFVIKDNVSGGEWDYDMLANQYELEELSAWGLDLPGVTELGADIEEDDVPEVSQQPPVSKLGEIYQLGRHRVMCGDSTVKENVEQLMAGVRADISFTSPPYNANKNSHLTGEVSGFDKKYQNTDDAMNDDDYLSLLIQTTDNALDHCDYVFVNLQMLTHNRLPLLQYQTQFTDKIKDILIWVKSIAPPNIVKGAFNTKWEYVFAISDNNKTRGFPTSWQGKYSNVIETENNSGNEHAKDHKAGYPVAFPLWLITKMDFAKTVLDLFIGTGTTLIACEQTDRTCYGMELDPRYVDVIRKRYWKFINNGDETGWENGTPVI